MNISVSAAVPSGVRRQALAALAACAWPDKLAAVRAIDDAAPLEAHATLAEPAGLPGRPAAPALVAPATAKKRAVPSAEGRAAVRPGRAPIESTAVTRAPDAAWRYAGMPAAFYRAWLRVAREEAYHFELLNPHLGGLGHAYGDFPAH